MNDRELIRKIHAGDKNALNKIVDRYYGDIYRFCLYLTADEAESYDITQEVFLRFMKYMSSYTHRNLKGYLLIIARNLCRDYFSRRDRENEMRMSDSDPALLPEDIYGEPGGAGNPELDHTELRYLFQGILSQLPAEQREVIALRFGEELKFREIAKVLGCSQSTVKSRYRLAITRLRKEMTDDEN